MPFSSLCCSTMAASVRETPTPVSYTHLFDEASSRSYGGPNAYGNPNAGNRIVVQGSSRTWRGTGSGMDVYEDFRRATDNAPSYRMLGNVFADCEMQKVWDENGSLFLTGAHHDGGVSVEMRQLTDKGEDLLSEYLDFEGELVLPDSPVALMGSTYSEGDEGRLLSDLWSEEELCARPRYMERAFGCPIEELSLIHISMAWQKMSSSVKRARSTLPSIPSRSIRSIAETSLPSSP